MIDGPQEAEGVPATVETGTSESDTPLSTETVSELDAELAEPATPVAPQTPDAAPEGARAKTKATRTKKAHTDATNTGVPREGSKTSQVIAMLRREGGTTLEEIVTAMGWQKHTTRAMMSAGGSLTKNHGLVITSEKIGDKRTYAIKA